MPSVLAQDDLLAYPNINDNAGEDDEDGGNDSRKERPRPLTSWRGTQAGTAIHDLQLLRGSMVDINKKILRG